MRTSLCGDNQKDSDLPENQRQALPMISEHTTLISLFGEEQTADLGVVICK